MSATPQQRISGVEHGRAVAGVPEVARRARSASRALARLPHETRNQVLSEAAHAIEQHRDAILEANQADCRAAERLVDAGKMSAAMLARLRLGHRGVEEMARKVREVTRLADPVGRVLAATELDDGLNLYKESCPLGVIGIVFEARPEVVSQVASLTLKSGNAVILKGGSEAARSNETLVAIWRDCLSAHPDVPADAVQLLHSRAEAMELLQMDRDVDLIIPRGSKELVEYVSEHSRVPVLGHGEGVCHVYVDRGADQEKALRVTFDSKVQGPAICNAAETLLVHKEIAPQFLPRVVAQLREAGVEIRGCRRTQVLLGEDVGVVPASEKDWSTEYSDLILSVKVVDDLEQAIAHINEYGSRHTDSIVTEDSEAAVRFLEEVDAASVFHNASTRFSDGYRYGFGAELGISNSKLHARGPMGLDGLTTYKYKLAGAGHIVAEYSSGAKQFKHRPLSPPSAL